MIVGRNEVQQLKEAGYTYHELAEIAKCPTPTIMQLGQYGTAPDKPIDLNVKELLEAKDKATAENVEEPKRPVGRPKLQE